MHTFSPSSMDSTTSGSIQSSSTAGDQELDSRSQPISSFLNLPHPSPTPHHHLHNLPSSLLHPLPNYLSSLQCPPPSNLNPMGFDTTWSTALCPSSSSPNPNLIDLGGPITSSPPPNPSTAQPPVTPADPQARNSKKRPRASRRAPTTVLTTDTSNFRAIVQEFTGIPALPLSASSCTRPRYDLFYATAPRHLLRPLAPFASSSLMADAIASTTRTSMQSPIFTFQSLLQSQTTPTMPDLGARLQGPSSYVARDIGCNPLRATVGICGESSRVRSNCPAPAPPDKGSEKGSVSVPASRSEGGVDSWILSSD